MLKSKDIPLLHDFAVVCEHGNLTRAAQELNTGQSAITQRMQRLEDVMGAKLLRRHSRGVHPTEQGEILLKYSRKLNALVVDAIAEVTAWEGSPSGAVSIGLPPSVSAVLTTPLIEAVNTALPNVELTVAEAFSGYLEGWLANDEIDFGFVFDRKSDATLEITELATERLFLICHPEQAQTLPRQLGLKDLAGLPLIAPSRRHGLRTGVEAVAANRGLKLNIRLEVDAGHQLIQQIERGVGAAVLARSAVMPELVDGRLIALPIVDPVFERTVCLALRKEKADSYLLKRVQYEMLTVVRHLIVSKTWPAELL
ncbi:LysR family transcriptional regulator [Mesobacterium sp. TK19101]|uniref:LysR family transcriptional regulator n=1 Tax=Mesobacterium hydrothermale TaxID=3111907 RepID=A0ABU6HHI7_9RHOB|nr:LysR family transcriptional regulator [Mesobacterium sp. TK19101]MEC3861806.1 LysR family transcriptional regulator [Mesobacterium sp. TK19101]